MWPQKFPRTSHLPWSPGKTSDDKTLTDDQVEAMFSEREVVVTEKLDGENTTFYGGTGEFHARSCNSGAHPSRNHLHKLSPRIAHDLPAWWRVVGENVYAKHSIGYTKLPGHFVVFAVINDDNELLSWDDTVVWAGLLDLPVVPLMRRFRWNRTAARALVNYRAAMSAFGPTMEGYVVRTAVRFSVHRYDDNVAKWVRKDHVQTDEHWMYQPVVMNELAK